MPASLIILALGRLERVCVPLSIWKQTVHILDGALFLKIKGGLDV